MSDGDASRFPITAHDLEHVLVLLWAEINSEDSDNREALKVIVNDLESLPSKEPRSFTLTFIHQFFAESVWASLDSYEGYLVFEAGTHIYEPGVGGDTYTDKLFECSSVGEAKGNLSDWLLALEQMEQSELKIQLECEELDFDEEVVAMQNDENFEERANRVQNDHYAQKALMIAVALYGWQLHGWAVGLAVYIGLFVIILISNTVVMQRSPAEHIGRNLRISRWGWVIAGGTVLAISGASFEEANQNGAQNATDSFKEALAD
ncbi:hypothetical protein [Parasphingorhabdus sp.]|uniref:hypothetical protein n=1 Tax=Parasphingorhabdus sp. TaxID=2709688 RepID=UPI002F9572A1